MYAIYNTNKKASITHVDTTRPRLIIDESIADSGLIHSDKQGENDFRLLVKVENNSSTPARHVRANEKFIISNNPDFSYKSFMQSECKIGPIKVDDNLYPQHNSSFIVVNGTANVEREVNTAPSSKDSHVEILNSNESLYVVGCVSYKMDEEDTIFTEGFIYSVYTYCKDSKENCKMFESYNTDNLPLKAELGKVF